MNESVFSPSLLSPSFLAMWRGWLRKTEVDFLLPKVSSFVCDRKRGPLNFDEIILAFVWKQGSRSGVAFEFAGNKSDSCQLSTSERHTPRRTNARQQTLDLLMALQRRHLSIFMRHQLLSQSGFLQGDLNDYGGRHGTIRSEGSGIR